MLVMDRVRELTHTYDRRVNDLKREFESELHILQEECDHSNCTRWRYELDTYGELASSAEGILYKARECLNCGIVQSKLDNINDYDSEIKF